MQVVLDVASIDTANAQRDEHLRTNDFFDAPSFPEITFRSTGVEVVATYDTAGSAKMVKEQRLAGVAAIASEARRNWVAETSSICCRVSDSSASLLAMSRCRY